MGLDWTGMKVGMKVDGDVSAMNADSAWLFDNSGRKLDYAVEFGAHEPDSRGGWANYEGSVGWYLGTPPNGVWGGSGYTLLNSIPMFPKNIGATLAGAAAGDYVTHWQNVLNALASAGQFWVRLGWEFNGDWYPWTIQVANGPADYAQAYRVFVETARAIDNRFRFDWNVNWDQQTVSIVEAAYPGDAYVDSISMDLYENSTYLTGTPAERWSKFVSVTSGVDLTWLASFATAHGKPIGIPENASNYDDGQFVQYIHDWAVANDVRFYSWWDSTGDFDGTFAGHLTNKQVFHDAWHLQPPYTPGSGGGGGTGIFNTSTQLNGGSLANSLARAYVLGASASAGTCKELVAGQNKAISFTGSASLSSDADGDCITSAGGGTSYADIAADGFTPAGTSFTAVVTFKPSTVNPQDWAGICQYQINATNYAFLFERNSNLNDLLTGVGHFHDSPIYNAISSLSANTLTTCVITWNGSDFKLFLPNATPLTSAYGASPQDAGAPTNLHIGDWAGKYYFFAYSNTAWSDAQAQAVADDIGGQLLTTGGGGGTGSFSTTTHLNGGSLANSLARAYVLGASASAGTCKELVAGQNKAISFTGSASLTSDADGACITSAGGGTSYADIAADGFTPAGTSFTAVVTFKPSTVNPQHWAGICQYQINATNFSFLLERNDLNDLLIGIGQYQASPIYNGVASLTADTLTTCVITWNGSDFKLFLPNIAPLTPAYGASPQDAGTPTNLRIGDWAGKYYFFAYSDTAWSDAQAQAVANDVVGQLLIT